MSERYQWRPATKAQADAIESEADILLFGGSAGSLKTETALMDAVQEYENPNLRAIVFRSSFVEMTDIIDKTRRLYTPLGGIFTGSPKWTWRFPSGATIRFAYMKTDEDVWKYLGPRYSTIIFDESTLHTEKQIRNMLGRLSSTDKTLRLRMRLTSNPGNIGAAWHMKLFLRGHCPVHAPLQSAVPGKLYHDCVWPSDGAKIPFSVAFIPGKLSDHNLLDEDYALRLRMMAGGAAAAMEQGCWCSLEGSYFPFLNNGMIRPLAEAGIEWWHSHILSIDYGYGKSSAAAGLYVRGPAETSTVRYSIPGVRSVAQEGTAFSNGRIRKVGELVVPHVPAYEFAQMVVDRFIAPHNGQQRRRIVAAYLDPANYKEIGDGHTIADQINEVLEPWDVVCERASNDRIGGWQLLYRMLRTGEFEITDVCPQTFEAIRTRMHDEKKPGDLRKIPGDPMDDVCLVGEMLIATSAGALPIKDVRMGDFVWTRRGLCRVTKSWMTSPDAATFTITLSDGSHITGTANHPIFVEGKGFIRLDALRYGDKILTCQNVLSMSIPSSTKASYSGVTPNRLLGAIAPTSPQALTTASGVWRICIERFTKITLGQFPKASWFTTKTKMCSTTIRATTNSSQDRSTASITPAREWLTRQSVRPLGSVSPKSITWQNLGMAAKKVWRGIVNTPRKCFKIEKRAHLNVNSAENHFALSQKGITDFARTLANLLGADAPVSMMSRGIASGVEHHLKPTDMTLQSPVAVHVLQKCAGPNAAVYNLSVEGANEFFANGILVHNCDETRYALYTFIQQSEKPRELRLAESIAGFDRSTKEGITSAAVRYQQMQERIDAEEAPVALGRVAWRRGRR